MTENVITFFEEQSLPLAQGIMKLKKIRHIPVIDDDRRLVGIVTHRDLLGAQGNMIQDTRDDDLKNSEPSVKVRDIMTRDVWTVKPDADAHEAAQLLLDHQFSCLPVTDDAGVLVGIVTDRDYLRLALEVLE
jgi:acetoin utilization protein AcuB